MGFCEGRLDILTGVFSGTPLTILLALFFVHSKWIKKHNLLLFSFSLCSSTGYISLVSLVQCERVWVSDTRSIQQNIRHQRNKYQSPPAFTQPFLKIEEKIPKIKIKTKLFETVWARCAWHNYTDTHSLDVSTDDLFHFSISFAILLSVSRSLFVCLYARDKKYFFFRFRLR